MTYKELLENTYRLVGLGLSKKVQDKAKSKDAIKNISIIKFEDSLVEEICHKNGVETVGDAKEIKSIENWFGNGKSRNGLINRTMTKNKIKYFKEFSLFDSLLKINDFAFNGCENLRYIVLPKNIKTIGNSSFSHCIDLQELIIPIGVVSISSYAFSYCIGLETLYIPKSVKKIGKDILFSCRNLKEIHISKECPVYEQIYNYPYDLVNYDPVDSLNGTSDSIVGENINIIEDY